MPTFMKKLSASADIKVGFNYFHVILQWVKQWVKQSYNAAVL